MVWAGIVVGIATIVLVVVMVTQRRRRPAHRAADDVEVDPLFTVGIALTGAGAVLATTIGGVMYAVMIVGLIVTAIGANRTRHPHH